MNKHQEWERSWWGDCGSTYHEETKQFVYARLMGLQFEWEGPGPRIDLKGKSVLDIGGGPVSMLLKTKNKGYCLVIDPCDYPGWISARYTELGIAHLDTGGEGFIEKLGDKKIYDEVLIYNVLQHTIDPEKIIQNARKVSKIIRIFEWIDEPASIGHPHTLTEKNLNKWLGGDGKVTMLNESGCVGKAYSGIFKGDHYENS